MNKLEILPDQLSRRDLFAIEAMKALLPLAVVASSPEEANAAFDNLPNVVVTAVDRIIAKLDEVQP